MGIAMGSDFSGGTTKLSFGFAEAVASGTGVEATAAEGVVVVCAFAQRARPRIRSARLVLILINIIHTDLSRAKARTRKGKPLIKLCAFAALREKLFQRNCAFELKTAPEEIRHLDEERSSITPEARFKSPAKRIEAVPIQIVVVPGIKRRPWIRSPTQQKLSFDVGG